VRLRQHVQQGSEGLAGVGLDPHRDGVDAADVPAVDVHLGDRRPGLDVARVVEARELSQPRADDQQEIRAPTRFGGLRRARPAERADVERIVVRHRVVPSVRGHHGQPVAGRQARHEVAGGRPRHAAAGEDEGALGAREEARRLANGLRMRRRRMGRPVGVGGEGIERHDLVVQHVTRDVDEHGSSAPAHRGAEREPERVRDAPGLGHPDREPRHRLEQGDEVELLEGVAAVNAERRAAGDCHDRRVRHVGSGDAGDEVRGARSAGHQTHRRCGGDSGEPVRHEGAALLVADVDILHAPVVVEHVQHVEERRADDAEDVPHAFGLPELHDGPAGAHLGHDGSLLSPHWRPPTSGGRVTAECRAIPSRAASCACSKRSI
jgi:hypothetical protein